MVSGAYVGDKTSRLFETTVLTAQPAEVDLYEHIRAMLWTIVPAFLIGAAVSAILTVRGAYSL